MLWHISPHMIHIFILILFVIFHLCSDSIKRGWGLFCVLAVNIRPTKSLYPSLLNFVEEHIVSTDEPDPISRAAHYARAKLEKMYQTGPRRSIPSLQEINLVIVRYLLSLYHYLYYSILLLMPFWVVVLLVVISSAPSTTALLFLE